MKFRKKWIIPAVLLLASAAFAMAWIYQVDPAICNGCGRCLPYCTTGALYMSGPNAVIDPDLCDGCGDCVPPCIRGAIYRCWYEGTGGDEDELLVTLSPNPASNFITLSNLNEGDAVNVLDLSGRVRLETAAVQPGELNIDVSKLPAGAFIVRIDDRFFAPVIIR